MRLAQAWRVARHDLGLLRLRRSIFAGLFALPLGIAVGFPLLLGYLVRRAGAGAIPPATLTGLMDAFAFWFVIGAATLPVAIASYSLVGEKLEKSLEPLLATPTTDGEILFGKVLSALVPTLAAIWASSTIFMGLMDLETHAELGYLYYPNASIALIVFVVTPLVALFAVEVSVLVSARATDARAAQQVTGLVFLPFILLYIVGEIGIWTLNTTHLLTVAGLLGALTLGLFTTSRRTFGRDEILTRWK